jgi:hypothetical protein
MGSGVELWENNGGTSGGIRHCRGCTRVMGRDREEHHRRPQGRVVLLVVVKDAEDNDDDGVGVGVDDGGDR